MLSGLHDIFPHGKQSLVKDVWMASKKAVWSEGRPATRIASQVDDKPDSQQAGQNERQNERKQSSHKESKLAVLPD
jgi:hypothetical protein